ncbi:synaptonemal complex central element protein 1 isoform X2 [Cyprinodon tularosa]|uniref:synaptonemal complex central element protein 1 isoform X2 n=1 Tax=Cyprinodon tularosa TaxID=77115 RepID=UPI0018E24F98|nr:synaptonemal complex central element protein 1 isoform X2 [Cyprinodon tularosa]
MSELSGGGLPEPKIEQLRAKLNMLQQVLTEVNELEGIHEYKQGMCRKLQLQCEESEQELDRQLNQTKMTEKLMEQHRCEIQEVKLKHRKLRMRFENQLLQLIEQHKQLDFGFNPKRLPDELQKSENAKYQLLSAEQVKLAQLDKLSEELAEAKKQKHLEAGAAQMAE